jgi:eukaryotic-like serine/threonine-protein kinase
MNPPLQPAEQAAASAAGDTLRQNDNELARAAALSGPRSEPPGAVPGYEVRRCLGNGAYGSVWLADERNTGKQVAIKFYSHRRGLDWSLLNREVEKLAVLYTSRDIVGLLQVGWDADPPYYVMEFLQNGSLSRLLEQGSLSVSEAVRIATAVTRALVHAHQHGILHCDVKPANVLLDGEFAPRLADFGQARLSHEQTPALGTLFYMAPEQADLNANPDPRWDVYALGALLYHMLCGEPPFRTVENEQAIRAAPSLEQKLAAYRQIVERGPRPAKHRALRGVDGRLADIVDRCLSADPNRRFRNAVEASDALAARARFRSLRPMIGLGIVLPGLLLLGLFPLAVIAVDNAADLAEKNIAERVLESDAVAAKVLAYSLDDDVTQRLSTLAEIADWPELTPLLVGATQPADSDARRRLQDYLADEKKRIDENRQKLKGELDESWFLNDAEGFQRWRDPPSPMSQEENYSWRDYFHGQGADHPEWKGRRDIKPIDEPWVSAPYRGTTADQLKIALSVPVHDANKRVVGVLGRTIRLGKLLGTYKRLVAEEWKDQTGERVIALLDIRSNGGRVLDHPWMTPQNLKKLGGDDVFDELTLGPAAQHELEELQRLVQEKRPVVQQNFDFKYYDPIRKVGAEAERDYGKPWLAAFWPVGDIGWFAVVQEKRDDALRPVRDIQQGLVRYSLAGLLLCVTLVVTSWYFVLRVMRSRVGPIGRRWVDGRSMSAGLTASGTEIRRSQLVEENRT